MDGDNPRHVGREEVDFLRIDDVDQLSLAVTSWSVPPEGGGDELEKQMATAMEVRMGGDTGVVLAAEPQKQH
jgi:hypothetical protein